MNSMEEQRLFELSTREIAGKATPEERRELDALIASIPANREHYERIKSSLVVAKDVLSLLIADEATGTGLSADHLAKLRKEVSDKLGSKIPARDSEATSAISVLRWFGTDSKMWRRVAVVGTACAFAALLIGWLWPRKTLIEIAWVDTRQYLSKVTKLQPDEEGETESIEAVFGWRSVKTIRTEGELQGWKSVWPSSSSRSFKVLVVHSPWTGALTSVQIIGRLPTGTVQEDIPVTEDLEAALMLAKARIQFLCR